MNNNLYTIQFDPNTIDHLGIKMYRTLPPVLAELIANAYDADAEKVTIEFNDNPRSITVTDDGHGMTWKELNDDFLVIGKDRREDGKNSSRNKGRDVTGRKGIGKLAMFGIANTIQVESSQENKKNGFLINYQQMRKHKQGLYHPKPLYDNENSNSKGTRIYLKEMERKTTFNIEDIAASLAERLDFFYKNDFKIILRKEEKEITIDQNYKDKQMKYEFKWDIKELHRNNQKGMGFIEENKIGGFVVTTKKPLKDDRGITLFARGKLVNKPEFYGLKEGDVFANSYLKGRVLVDYIDNKKEDLISTSRDSLVWDNPELDELHNFLQLTIGLAGGEWNKKRKKAKKQKVEQHNKAPVDEWINRLPNHEKQIADNLLNAILDSGELSVKKSVGIINYIQAAFQFEAFKEFAHSLSATKLDIPQILDLIREWNLVEAKEMHRLCIGRIEAIKKLEEYINSDTPEIGKDKSMHKFLEEFPWLLEPRASKVKSEVRYADILRREFPEEKLDGKDRRIDFLCLGFFDNMYIIEIKRAQKVINKKDIRQLEDYMDFVKGNARFPSKCLYSGYIIGKNIADSNEAREARNRAGNNRMYIKTYADVLELARRYHQELLEAYNELASLREEE